MSSLRSAFARKWLAALPLLAITALPAAAQDAPAQKVYGRTPAESSPPVWPQPVRAAKGRPTSC